MKRILFPVDFSERSRHAAPFVAAMARRHNAEVTILHAVNRADYVFGLAEAGAYGGEDVYERAVEGLGRQLDTFGVEEFDGIPVTRVLARGTPADEIIRYERENGIWLIMLPTHGLGPFRRFILGSVTAKVLHDAMCAVWTSAHIEEHPVTARHTIDRVMAAIDLGDASESVVRWANDLAIEEKAALTVCYVAPVGEVRPNRYLNEEFAGEIIREARRDIAAMLGKLGIKAAICVSAGEVAKGVRTAAEGHRADAVVIGRGEAAGGGRLRANAYSIIRNAPVPVISL